MLRSISENYNYRPSRPTGLVHVEKIKVAGNTEIGSLGIFIFGEFYRNIVAGIIVGSVIRHWSTPIPRKRRGKPERNEVPD